MRVTNIDELHFREDRKITLNLSNFILYVKIIQLFLGSNTFLEIK